MRGTLFGLQIPDAAMHVTVRPIVGQGNRRALYRGPVDEDGRVLSDDDIKDAVARDLRFWEYVERSLEAGSLPEGDPKRLSCRVSVQFTDSGGAAIALNDQGETWAQSKETVEFLRTRGGKKKRKRRTDGARAVSKALAEVMPAIRDTLTAALKESAAVNKEALAINKDVIEALKESLRRENARVDSGITELADRAKGAAAQPAPSSGGFKTLIEGIALLKEAKSFLN